MLFHNQRNTFMNNICYQTSIVKRHWTSMEMKKKHKNKKLSTIIVIIITIIIIIIIKGNSNSLHLSW